MIFWRLVPKDDGYHYVSINDNGNYFLIHKAEKSKRNLGRLTFCSKENAEDYINKHNLFDIYGVESFEVTAAFFEHWQNDYE